VFQIYNQPVGEPSPIPSQSSTVLKVPVMRVVQVAWGALASRGEERTVVAAAHQRKRVAMVREANMFGGSSGGYPSELVSLREKRKEKAWPSGEEQD
jgi:hypothetical protein